MRFHSLFGRVHYVYLATAIYVLFACLLLLGIIRHHFAERQDYPVSLRRSSQTWNTEGRVYSLTYSPDGQLLASVETLTRDTENEVYVVRLRQIPTGKILHTLGGQPEKIYSLAFSHSGELLATGDQGANIHLWRVADGTLLTTMKGHSGPVQQVLFAPTDTTLLSVSDDYSIREWDIPDGTLERTIDWTEYYTCGIAHAVFAGNEPRFVVREATTIVLYSYPDQEVTQKIQGFDGTSCYDFEKIDVRFNASATLLASVDALDGRKSSIRVWDLGTGRQQTLLNGHTDKIMSLAFSPDNQFLASASGVPYFMFHTDGDLSIRIWRISNGEPVAILNNAHYGAIVGLVFSPDNLTLASGGVDGTIQFWRIPQ